MEKVQLLWFYSEAFSQLEAAWTGFFSPTAFFPPHLNRIHFINERQLKRKKTLPRQTLEEHQKASKEKSSATLSITVTEWTFKANTAYKLETGSQDLQVYHNLNCFTNTYRRHALCPHCSAPLFPMAFYTTAQLSSDPALRIRISTHGADLLQSPSICLRFLLSSFWTSAMKPIASAVPSQSRSHEAGFSHLLTWGSPNTQGFLEKNLPQVPQEIQSWIPSLHLSSWTLWSKNWCFISILFVERQYCQ